MFIDVCLEALWDSLKILPFLFFAFLALEALEYYSGQFSSRLLSGVGKAGPAAGALLGLVPQCGFSAAAANLYSGGVVTLGTLLAVFLATSDEAVLIFLGQPEHGGVIGRLLLAKFVIGLLAGYGVDIFLRKKGSTKEISDLCSTCGCHDAKGILRPALIHTRQIFLWILVITLALNLGIAWLGTERLAVLLGSDLWFQPFLTALVGLTPNCAASVLLAKLYLTGGLSFSAAVAGLCSGAGLGLVVLFRMEGNKKECMKILVLLYGIAALSGMVLQVLGV